MSQYKNAKMTPMMKQYVRFKKEYPDCILFFRLGDFYEMFFEDAKVASRALDITLTTRGRDLQGKKIPLAGIPYHAIDNYLAKMVKAGHKVAICEQMEDPKLAKGVVKRDVIRVITPGTVLETSLLSEKSNNYLMALHRDKTGYGLALIDVSTGEFMATTLDAGRIGSYVKTGRDEKYENALFDRLASEIIRFRPAECIMPPQMAGDRDFVEQLRNHHEMAVNPYDEGAFNRDMAFTVLTDHFGTMNLEGMGIEDLPAAISAAGAALSYVKDNQKHALGHISSLHTFSADDYMVLDSTTLRNLEVVNSIRDGSHRGTLLEVVDHTSTAMGSRLLRKWLVQPIKNIEEIGRRLDAVESLLDEALLREDLQDALSGMNDLERLMSRIVYGSANARDLIALRNSLAVIPRLQYMLGLNRECTALTSLAGKMEDLPELRDAISDAVVDEPPATVREGGMLKDGYDEQLDELRHINTHGREWIASLEEKERERTGIDALKIGYNKIFGFYIEVPIRYRGQMPEDYICKQTLTRAERYITPEIKERESDIVNAEEKAKALEYELFNKIRERAGADVELVQRSAIAVAGLDCLASLGKASAIHNFTRPEITGDDKLDIKDGRHPVVEHMLRYGAFVPNDCYMDPDDRQIMIITGPNMAGKSTYMRQNALIVLLAQMGCFVPASSARIGLVDRIFTRVGAFDDLSRGQSTFMVEMTELANILNNVTHRSLVLLDEIGRGTSTYDGLSLAWAVVEYLHGKDGKKPKTMFATHYHQLTGQADLLSAVFNTNIAVKEREDEIVFLRKVIPGSTDRSYGIQVARLAGLPGEVVKRAKEVLVKIEEDGLLTVEKRSGPTQTVLFGFDGEPLAPRPGGKEPADDPARGAAVDTEVTEAAGKNAAKVALSGEVVPGKASSVSDRSSYYGMERKALLEMEKRLRGTELDTLTPLEALQELYRLKRILDEGEKGKSRGT